MSVNKRSKVNMEELLADQRVFASIVEQKRLVCVEVPAIVEDDDRAIACLGGINAISKARTDSGTTLEMRYRPEDRYCKPTVAREEKVTNLVLKVRRRKAQTDDGAERKHEYSVELLGIANENYHFPGMADYQVLCPGLNTSPLSHAHPNDFQLSEPLEDGFCERQLPTFFPPAAFSKFDKPFNYLSPKTGTLVGGEEGNDSRHRPKRVHNIYGYMCDYKGEIPTEPHPQAYGLSYAEHPKIKELRKLFEERPLWSRTALQYRVKLTDTFLRCLLSVLCYKFLSMPFKHLWVKFGYDPRQDPSSKRYQSIDYRVPQDLMTMIPESRRQKPCRIQTTVTGAEPSANKSDKNDETSFAFLPDKWPSQRQLIYQLCDIRDPEVQELIHANDSQEPHFVEPNGWCEAGTHDRIRKLLTTRLRSLCEVSGKDSPAVGGSKHMTSTD